MADIIYPSIQEGVDEKLVDQKNGSWAATYVAAPQPSLPTDILYPAIQEGVYKRLVLQPDGKTYAEVVQIQGGSGGNFQWVPYMRFVAPTSGLGQVFTNPNLASYTLAEDIDIFLNGLKLDVSMYALLGNSIRIDRNLNQNDILTIDSKAISTVPSLASYRLLENGVDRRITEDGNLRILEKYVP